MRFIRDDIRVRDLDARYKKVSRWCARRDTLFSVGPGSSWNKAINIPVWNAGVLIEKLYLKGA